MARASRGGTRSCEYDGPPLEPLDLYTKKSGDEIVGAALQLHRQGRPRGRAASGDDADVRAHGRRARERAAQAGALVLDAAAVPLRAAAEGAAARALPAQRRHRRRDGRRRRRRAAGRGARDHARAAGSTPSDVRRARVRPPAADGAADARRACPTRRCRRVYAVDRQDRARPARRARPRSWRQAGLSAAVARTRARRSCRVATSTTLRRAHRRRRRRVASALDRVRALPRATCDALGRRATGSTFDLTIVRGLAYYTGSCSSCSTRKGEFRAICGGGRYDNLLASLGGVDLPALGFGMGDVVLGELLRARGLHAVERRRCRTSGSPQTERVTDAEVVRRRDCAAAMGASRGVRAPRAALSKQRKAAWRQASCIVEVRPRWRTRCSATARSDRQR